MKRILILSFFLSACVFGFGSSAYAADEKINAGLIPSVWYSVPAVYENEDIKIYAGFQNHSSSTFSGNAIFLVDGVKVGEASFSSSPETLIELASAWKAVPGSHKILVSIASATVPLDALLVAETEEHDLKVKKRTGVEAAVDKAIEVANAVIENVGKAADSLNEKLESLHLTEPVTTEQDGVEVAAVTSAASTTGEVASGVVLGASTSTKAELVPQTKGFAGVYNQALDVAGYVLEHWKAFLIGLGIAIVILKFVLKF